MALWLDNRIELELPARAELFVLARMTAVGIAGHAQFPREQVDDLRLAVDELLLTLIRGRATGRVVHMDFEWSHDTIEVVATLHEDTSDHRHPDKVILDDAIARQLSESILGAVVDQHGSPGTGDVPIAWLKVRRRPVEARSQDNPAV